MKPVYLFALIATVSFGSYQLGKRQSNPEPQADAPQTSAQTAPATATAAPLRSQSQPQAQGLAADRQTANAILAIPNADDQLEAFDAMLENMRPQDARELLATLENLEPGPQRQRLLSRFFERWGEISGAEAYTYAMTMPGRERLRFLSQAAEGWATRDPESAWGAMMDATNNGAMNRPQLRGILSKIAAQDPAMAFQLLKDADNTQYNSRRFNAILSQAANHGKFAETLEAVLAHPNANRRDEFSEQLFARWGSYQFDEPLNAIERLTDPAVSKKAMHGFMKGWAEVDGQGAFDYALQNRDDPRLVDSLPEVAKTWTRSATAAELTEVVKEITQLDDRETILKSLLQPVAQANPVMALDINKNLQDANERARNTGRIMSTWARSDLVAAETHFYKIKNEADRRSAAAAITYALVNSESSPDRVMNLFATFEDKDRALSYLVNAGSSPRLASKSIALKERLLEEIPQMQDVSERTKNRALRTLTR